MRIYLSHLERKDLQQAITRLARDTDLPEAEVFLQAEIDTLPPHRRRQKPPGLYRRSLRQAFVAGRKSRQQLMEASGQTAGGPDQNGPVMPPEPVPVAVPKVPELPAVQEPGDPPLPDPLTGLRNLPTADLLEELVQRLLREVDARLERFAEQLRGAAPPARPAVPAPLRQESPVPARIRHPRIAVVGLLADQFEHVRQKVRSLPFELVYVAHDRASRSFPGCHYIVASRHITHNWETSAIQTVGREHYAFAPGGVTAVVQAVYDFHARLTASRQRQPAVQ